MLNRIKIPQYRSGQGGTYPVGSKESIPLKAKTIENWKRKATGLSIPVGSWFSVVGALAKRPCYAPKP
jgi:hypothetical protein